ncbi:MAG: FMN-binding protein [Muribaculaceae bacterium]|nr:FMN-binding protein [Muribaculaceae bacterium]
MKKINRLFSFFVVALMLTAAAIAVHKDIFGYKTSVSRASESTQIALSDRFTIKPEGIVIIHTAALPETVDGYAGPVPLEIYLKEGTISHIEPLPNVETPSFFKRASVLFDEWIGKTPEQAMDMKIDGVSGATYTSAAIVSNMNAGLACYVGAKAGPAGNIPWKMWVALAVTLVACIIPLFVKNKIYHNVQLVANVVVLGFWCGQFLDYALILKFISSGFSLPGALVAIVMLIAAFIYPLFGRPQHYCTHICPLGAAQQLVGELCGYKIHLSVKVLKALDWFRKILWAVLMLFLWTDTFAEWMDLELFQAFQFRSASWWIIGAAALFIALSAIVSRPYCRFVCPTGSLFKRSENIG